jgi:hypothetical protein
MPPASITPAIMPTANDKMHAATNLRTPDGSLAAFGTIGVFFAGALRGFAGGFFTGVAAAFFAIGISLPMVNTL